MKATIAVLPGDGIGTEVAAEAERLLQRIAERHGHTFTLTTGLIGGAAIDATGSPLPDETLALCQAADAVLLGAVGGPKWSDPNAPVRPEQGLLALRKASMPIFVRSNRIRWPRATRRSRPKCWMAWI